MSVRAARSARNAGLVVEWGGLSRYGGLHMNKHKRAFCRKAEAMGFTSWYDALFGGDLKVNVFSPTSVYFIKFQTKTEIDALESWKLGSDRQWGGASRASLMLKDCQHPDAKDDTSKDDNDVEGDLPDIFVVEAMDRATPKYKKFGRFSGVVAPIPIHAQGNTDGDSSRPGFCSVLTPEVVDPFLPENFNMVEMRVRSNLRSFLFNFHPEEQETMSRFQSLVRVSVENDWHTIEIPYQAFKFTTRGRLRRSLNPFRENYLSGAGITVRSYDARPWDSKEGEEFEAVEFQLDIQWIRFVRRPQSHADKIADEHFKMEAREEYAEFLVEWKEKGSLLIYSGLITSLDQVAGFSLDEVLAVKTKHDVESTAREIQSKGINDQTTSSWTHLPLEDLLSVEEELGIPYRSLVRNNDSTTL
ncbi:hypothetical protein AAMO2058_000925800 [Amorphochlora amoebiformis]